MANAAQSCRPWRYSPPLQGGQARTRRASPPGAGAVPGGHTRPLPVFLPEIQGPWRRGVPRRGVAPRRRAAGGGYVPRRRSAASAAGRGAGRRRRAQPGTCRRGGGGGRGAARPARRCGQLGDCPPPPAGDATHRGGEVGCAALRPPVWAGSPSPVEPVSCRSWPLSRHPCVGGEPRSARDGARCLPPNPQLHVTGRGDGGPRGRDGGACRLITG